MSYVSNILDGIQSLATRLGTSLDKAATSSYQLTLLNDQQLEAAFRTSWVARKVVVIPALDATRKWRRWVGPDARKIREVENSRSVVVRAKVYEAFWKARLFGGAAVLIGVDDDDWSAPLEPETIRPGGLKYLTVLTTRHDLVAGLLEDDPRDPRFGKPRYYEINTTSGIIRVHPSRLVEFRGNGLPRWDSGGSSYGWGDSVLQSCYEAVRNLDATMANIASLVFDAKTDIVRIPGLSANITNPAFEEALFKRFSAARMLKGNHGTLILDAEEMYDSRPYTFGGLDSIADRFMQVVSGAADIPITRFMGTSPKGLDNTAQHDLLNYYDMIASLQSAELGPALAALDDVIIRSADVSREEHTYEWVPLIQLDEKKQSEIHFNHANTITSLVSSGILDPRSVADLAARLFDEVAPLQYNESARSGDDQ